MQPAQPDALSTVCCGLEPSEVMGSQQSSVDEPQMIAQEAAGVDTTQKCVYDLLVTRLVLHSSIEAAIARSASPRVPGPRPPHQGQVPGGGVVYPR